MKLRSLIQFIKQFLNKINIKTLLNRKRLYKSKVSLETLLALFIWFYYLNLRNFKQYYSRFIQFYYKDFNLSYSRFMFWKIELTSILKILKY